MMPGHVEVPVLLLKTRTQPKDGYEDYFNSSSVSAHDSVRFKPIFVPVLEHQPNNENLDRLKQLLKSERLNQEYGGMVFTSQRAVEGWRGIVEDVESGRCVFRSFSTFNLFRYNQLAMLFDMS